VKDNVQLAVVAHIQQLSGTALIATQRVVARKFEKDTCAYPTNADHPLVW
jgi:hypothetical protein